MEFDFTTLSAKDRYRLLCSFVVPRPIALVTTIGENGAANAAPMSFFNVFSQDPPHRHTGHPMPPGRKRQGHDCQYPEKRGIRGKHV